MTAHDKAVRVINTGRKPFTILDLACAAGIRKDRAELFVTTMVRKGYLRKIIKAKPARGHLGYGRYELVKMIPARAPIARTRIWRSMRMMRRFTIADLAATADASLQNTHTYVRDLVNGGYLRKLKNEVPRRGVEGRAIFALVKDTGPLAPRMVDRRTLIGAGSIIDPNVVGQEEEGGCSKNQSGSRPCAANARAAARQQ